MMTWDTDLIYQYYRITGDNRLLLGGADLFYTYAAMEKMHPKRILKKLTKYLQSRNISMVPPGGAIRHRGAGDGYRGNYTVATLYEPPLLKSRAYRA